jgi:2-(1,2-epoxy-1,2-dihydrophenyl)acetyl-CoA isomerase
MTSPLLVERHGSVATLTLNRPESLNTLDFALIDALIDAAADVAADDTLRVVVLRGAGRHFMAGGDLRTFATKLAKTPIEREADFRHAISRLHSAVENFHRMPHPVVGQVHGAVAGFGLSLMNACDLVVAADNTYFASAYRNIALTPDGGGSWSLPRIVGMRRAMEILLLGERFDAYRALELGLAGHGAGHGDPQRQAPGTRIARAHVIRATRRRGREFRRVLGHR